MRFNAEQICRATGGAMLVEQTGEVCDLTGLSWDSRTVQPGYVYAALPGQRVDGHDFLPQAFSAGAALALVSRDLTESESEAAHAAHAAVVKVDDVARAISDLAAAWRDVLKAEIVGVTGSVGKTTTRSLIYGVLASAFEADCTKGNFNNELGMPYTLLQTEPSCEVLVLEMGMDGLGQIADLARIARPKYGVITNVGVSHLERLGTRDNIARAKAEMVEGLPDGEGVAFLQADGEYTDFIIEHARAVERGIRIVRFDGTAENSDVYATDIAVDDQGRPSFTLNARGESASCTLSVRGVHNVTNACAAAAVGLEFGIALDQVAAALSGVEPESGRQALKRSSRGFLVFDDAYNASPESMAAALNVLASFSASGRRIAVLGDMGELGSAEVEGHINTGKAAAQAGIDMLVCVGAMSRYIADAARKGGMAVKSVIEVADADAAAATVLDIAQPGDVVLVKASHFMGLDRVVERVVS